MANEGFYVDRNKTARSIYCSVEGKATPVRALYGNVKGKTELIWGVAPPPPAFIETLTYMQDCANYSLSQLKEGMVEEKPYTLIDSRDNTEYTIALLKDGNIWMCENLRIGSNDNSMTLTYDNSDFGYPVSGGIAFPEFELPKGNASGFIKNDTNYDTSNLYIDPEYGGFYTWVCATAGSGAGLQRYADAPYSILPKGWRLPKAWEGGSSAPSTYDSSEIKELALQYNNNKNGEMLYENNPIPGFRIAGYYDSKNHGDSRYGTSWGNVWTTNAYYYNTTAVLTQIYQTNVTGYYFSGGNRIWGCNIRGICKGNGAAGEKTPTT